MLPPLPAPAILQVASTLPPSLTLAPAGCLWTAYNPEGAVVEPFALLLLPSLATSDTTSSLNPCLARPGITPRRSSRLLIPTIPMIYSQSLPLPQSRSFVAQGGDPSSTYRVRTSRCDELWEGYCRLKDCLPVSNQKSSKVSLLNRATTHIKYLRMTQGQLSMRLQQADLKPLPNSTKLLLPLPLLPPPSTQWCTDRPKLPRNLAKLGNSLWSHS